MLEGVQAKANDKRIVSKGSGTSASAVQESEAQHSKQGDRGGFGNSADVQKFDGHAGRRGKSDELVAEAVDIAEVEVRKVAEQHAEPIIVLVIFDSFIFSPLLGYGWLCQEMDH